MSRLAWMVGAVVSALALGLSHRFVYTRGRNYEIHQMHTYFMAHENRLRGRFFVVPNPCEPGGPPLDDYENLYQKSTLYPLRRRAGWF